MKFQVGLLILIWHVVGKLCSAEVGGVCLLQLRNEKYPSELKSEHRLTGDQDGPGKDVSTGLSLPLTSNDKIRSENTAGEVELQHHVRRSVDEIVTPPQAPAWDEYPEALVDILETMVVTRWNGDRKKETVSRD
jgi:hypothetical protein